MEEEISEETIYYVTCADWETIAISSSHDDAATIAVEEIFKKRGKQMVLAPHIATVDMKSTVDQFDLDNNCEFHDTVRILSNAGLHESAKKYRKIIDLL